MSLKKPKTCRRNTNSNNLADFNNVNKEFLPENSSQKIPPKKILPKISPKNNSRKIHPKKFLKNSKKKLPKISKKSKKNSNNFSKNS